MSVTLSFLFRELTEIPGLDGGKHPGLVEEKLLN
jgi:hypothetical protein